MKYRSIPRTDLEVSLIGLGTMTWGEQNTEAEGHEQMDYALEQGINLFDVAEMYPVPPRAETCHETERIMGTWFASRPGAREKVILATKVVGPGPHVTHVRGPEACLDRANIEAAIEGSLRRLQTDHIDLYQLHWPDRPVPLFGKRDYVEPDPPVVTTPIEDTLAVLQDLKDAGKVRYFGLSNETPWGTMKFLHLAETKGLPRMVTIQNSYNLLNRTFDGGLSEVCHREDVRLLAYSPLAFGRLSGKYLNGARPEGARCTLWERFARYSGENADAATGEYCRIAREAGLDPAQMALAWINQRPHVASNLIGATTMEQLRSNIASVDVTLDQEVLDAIESVHRRIPNPCP
ncbi:MAG: NADP(H)-dependent aldo-keto reductase [Verrucomicrobiae bacterium]|nr:NADP(H)-dependent aldo-keto reductase [Verrucomicrobiae bacterium]